MQRSLASFSDIHGVQTSMAWRILSAGPHSLTPDGPLRASCGHNEITSSSSNRYSRPASSLGSTAPHRSRRSLRSWPNRTRRRVSFLGSLTCRRTVGRFLAFTGKLMISAEEPVVIGSIVDFNLGEIITRLPQVKRVAIKILHIRPRLLKLRPRLLAGP